MTSPFALRVRRVEGSPIVALRVWLLGGTRVETLPGQALVTGRALAEGTRRRDFRRIAEEAEGRGMILASFGGFELHGLALDALSGDWRQALDWAAELLFEPSFPADRHRWLCTQAAGELESSEDQADVATARAFMAQLYAPHPRGRPVQGSAESLALLTPADCAAFHADALRHGVIVAIVGVLDEAEVTAAAEALFADLAGPIEPGAEPPPPAAAPPPRSTIHTRATDQAHLFVGHRTIDRRHPDHAALELLSVVLGAGAGLTGRIPARIREREGLAYSASAEVTAGAGLDPGRLVCYVGCSPDTVAAAERGVREELARLLADGLTDEEMEEARSYVLGREPFRRETARQWADLLVASEIYGLPLADPAWTIAETARLTRAEVEAAARRHLDVERLCVTVGLPSAG